MIRLLASTAALAVRVLVRRLFARPEPEPTYGEWSPDPTNPLFPIEPGAMCDACGSEPARVRFLNRRGFGFLDFCAGHYLMRFEALLADGWSVYHVTPDPNHHDR